MRASSFGLVAADLPAEVVRVGCRQVRQVSVVNPADAHRFYSRKGAMIGANYFLSYLQPRD